jgi:hypothetical protein
MTIQQRRAGRTAFGTLLILGAVALAVDGLTALRYASDRAVVPAWIIVAFTWAIAIGAYFLAAHETRASSDTDAYRSEQQRMRSLTRPAVGLALMLPLTIHMPLAIAIGGPVCFDGWSGLTVPFAGVAHLIFAALIAERVKAIARGAEHRGLLDLYLWTVVGGLIPIVIPAIVVAITALPLLATLLPALDAMAASEHAEQAELPRAIVRVTGNIGAPRRAA